MWEEEICQSRFGGTFDMEKIKESIYLRPNLLHTRKFVIDLLFLLFPRRSDRSARAQTAINVLLFFLGRFQNLEGMKSATCSRINI